MNFRRRRTGRYWWTPSRKAKTWGLVNALTKMKSVGRIAITATLGYDIGYTGLIPTPTGRKIRFISNRQIRFGEAYTNSQTIAYNLTGGEFDLNDNTRTTAGAFCIRRPSWSSTKRARSSVESVEIP